jgi:hypothetical protein
MPSLGIEGPAGEAREDERQPGDAEAGYGSGPVVADTGSLSVVRHAHQRQKMSTAIFCSVAWEAVRTNALSRSGGCGPRQAWVPSALRAWGVQYRVVNHREDPRAAPTRNRY